MESTYKLQRRFRLLFTLPSLLTSLITPTSNTNKERYQFFEFTSNVTCLDGTCGNITAGLIAYKMGLPIDLYIGAQNKNKALWFFLGVWYFSFY